jgi:hypothetical protein
VQRLTRVALGEMHELPSFQRKQVFAAMDAVVVASDIWRLGRDRTIGILLESKDLSELSNTLLNVSYMS